MPVVLGILVGALAALDPLLSMATVVPLGFGEVARLVPYLYCICVVVCALTLVSALALRPALRGRRDVVLGGAVIVGMYMSGIGIGQASLTAAAALLLLGAWLFDRLLRPARPWNPTIFTALMALFMGCGLLSLIGAPSTFVGLASFVAKAIVGILLIDTLRSMRDVRTSVEVLIWATVVSAFLALLQVVASTFYGYNFTLVEEKSSALVVSPWGQLIVQASAFTRENNSLACMLATVSLLTLSHLFGSRGWLRRVCLGTGVVLMWSMAFLSTVRGSWVAITVGVLAFPYIVWPRRWAQWTGIMVVVSTLALSSGAVAATLRMMESIRSDTVGLRIELLVPGIDAALTYPLNGKGPGTAVRYSPYNRWGPHNTPVQIASDFGIPAMVIFILLVLWIGVRLAWAAGWAATPVARAQCLGMLVGYVSLITVMQSEPMAYGQFLWVYLGLCEAGASAAIAVR